MHKRILPLMVLLIFSLLSCTSSGDSGNGSESENGIKILACDLPNSPWSSLEYRYVMTEDFEIFLNSMTPKYRENFISEAKSLPIYPYFEYRASPNEPWTKEEIIHKPATPIQTLVECSSYWQNKAVVDFGEISVDSTATTIAKSSTTTKAPRKYSSSDPEYQLAAIDKGTQYPTDSAIKPYANTLSRLSKKCNERPISLSDMTVTAQELLEDKGRKLSLLEILNKVNNFIPNGSTVKSNCIEVFTALVVLD